MGCSPTAYIAFGFSLGEDFEGEEFDLEDIVSEEALAQCPVDVEYEGHYEYATPIIVLNGYSINASWSGSNQEVTPADLIVPHEKVAAAKTWCEDNGVPWEEPKWLLFPYYG